MTIACLGITVLDRVFRVPQLPTTGGKFVANDYMEIGGGPAATAAVAISKLGESVDIIARVGEDAVADTMAQEMAHYGVSVNHLHTVKGASSAFSAVVVDDEGERMIINYQDAGLSRDPQWLEAINFDQYRALLCDVRWLEGAKYALQAAKDAGVPSVLDADITPEDITDLVELADHIVFSQPGLAKFSQSNDPIEGLQIAQQKTSGKVYVTVGSDGCFWLEGDKLCHKPGFKVDVVDTTGAGDVFHGAFTLAIAEQMPTDEAVVFSSAVAALKCTQMGGREGIPSRDQVTSFIQDER